MSNIKIRKGKSTSIYKNRYCECDGILFQSVREMTYYICVRNQKLSGEIKDFKRQVTYSLDIDGIHIAKYKADFVVYNWDGTFIVVDVKGVRTAIYRMKKALMLICHRVKIKEIV